MRALLYSQPILGDLVMPKRAGKKKSSSKARRNKNVVIEEERTTTTIRPKQVVRLEPVTLARAIGSTVVVQPGIERVTRRTARRKRAA
jgi:hypothetical protein